MVTHSSPLASQLQVATALRVQSGATKRSRSSAATWDLQPWSSYPDHRGEVQVLSTLLTLEIATQTGQVFQSWERRRPLTCLGLHT